MKTLTSFQELETLGESLSKDYVKKTHCWNSHCFDIEGFITDYLNLKIVYEEFAENDLSKIGFMADGKNPLRIRRNGRLISAVYPKGTIVLEKSLLKEKESSRRRFTLAHEAAHMILEQHMPKQTEPAFHSDYSFSQQNSWEDLKKTLSLIEAFANRLGATILMPDFMIAKALKKYNGSRPLITYDGGVFAPEDKISAQRMADSLGVSFTALINRLKDLKLLEVHPIEEYITGKLHFGEGL